MPSNLPKNRIIVGVTGASGAPYADVFIRTLLRHGLRTYVVFTDTAKKVIKTEAHDSFLSALADLNVFTRLETQAELCQVGAHSGLSPDDLKHLRLFANDDLYAPIASGSEGATHMVVVPSSMGTLARIAHGMSGCLLERAADVMLKEKRPLLIVPRETPLSPIHLQNMLTLAHAGAHIIPAMPAFYQNPKGLDDLIWFVVERILDSLRLPELAQVKKIRWNARLL